MQVVTTIPSSVIPTFGGKQKRNAAGEIEMQALTPEEEEPDLLANDDMGRRGQILWIRGLTRLQHQVSASPSSAARTQPRPYSCRVSSSPSQLLRRSLICFSVLRPSVPRLATFSVLYCRVTSASTHLCMRVRRCRHGDVFRCVCIRVSVSCCAVHSFLSYLYFFASSFVFRVIFQRLRLHIFSQSADCVEAASCSSFVDEVFSCWLRWACQSR